MKLKILSSVFCLLPSVFFPAFSHAQVTADFSGSVTSGCSPLVVAFNDLSSGSPNQWNWNLGNGNNSTLQNPGATYVTPGTYTVTLTATNTSSGSSDTETKTAYITVFANPVANISANPTSGCVPLSVNFTDQSTLGSGAINQWFWDFGDGNTSGQQSPSHTYLSAGNYTVKLQITDVNGCTNTFTSAPNFINAFIGAVANFTASPTSSCTFPLSVNFNNTSTGSGGLIYQWNFGDGSPVSGAVNPSHTYNNAGNYNVTLVVTDGGGCKDTLIQTNFIKIIQADFSATPLSGCIPLTVNFTDLSLGSPTTWLWDFGDFVTSTQQNPAHAYAASGTYTVTLTAGNGTCTDNEVKTNYVTVSVMPPIDFTASDTVPCQAPAAISFTDNTVGSVSWVWNFGDGGTSASANPTHTYAAQGNYTVSLIVTVANGCKDTLIKNNYIILQKPKAIFSVDTIKGCVPLSVQFTDASTSGSPIVSWSWDFGDGNTSISQNPSHTYIDTGHYLVNLIITNSKGCVDSTTIVDTTTTLITVGQKPTADFIGSPLSGCKPLIVNFTDQSSSFANTWLWMFGDGATDNTQNPSHTYNDTGFFDVTLIVSNNGCRDTLKKIKYVDVFPPKAVFSVLPGTIGCAVPFTITLQDQSQGADTWFWDFGGGNTFTGQNPPAFTYTVGGQYSIKLVVTNNASGCADSTFQTIRISDPQANFSVTGTGCQPLLVTFTDLSSSPFGLRNWQWNFGDGNSIDNLNNGATGTTPVPNGTNNFLTTGTYENPKHTYMNPGQYSVTLTITDQLVCSQTITLTNIITVNQLPVIDFTSDKQVGCPPFTVSFTDISSGVVGMAKWNWDFGDGVIDSVKNPVHTYNNGGVFTVTLIATDSNGCISGIVKNSYITVISPVAGFSSATGACIGIPIVFADTSTAQNPIVSWSWDFGDSGTDNVKNPSHTYGSSGQFTVTLSVIDSLGCTDTVFKTNYITVQSVTANFGANPTSKNCPPLNVQFSDSSSAGIVTWLWDFGDNSGNASIQNPSHFYTAPGSYDVTLIVTTSLGCKDTIVKPTLININGPNGSFTFAPDTGCPGTIVHFDTLNVKNAISFTWDFGDGSLGSGAPVNHTYNQVGIYHPLLIFQDVNGCSFGVQSADSINIQNIPVDAGPDKTICEGQSTTLQASGGAFYAWNTNSSLSDTSIANPTATPADTTKYYVLITRADGCTGNDSVTVFVKHNVPVANFSATTVCKNDSTLFTDLSTIPGDSIILWNWNFSDAGALSTDTNPAHVYSSAGNFNVNLLVTSNNGCLDSITKQVVVNPIPNADAGNDTSICAGKSAHLQATGGVSYSWLPTSTLNNPNIANPIATPAGTTQYFAIVADANNCVDTDNVSVFVNQLPNANAGNDLQICRGDSTTLSAGGGVAYAWNANGSLSDTSIAAPVAKPVDTTMYVVSVTDFNGCVNTDTVVITVNPNFPNANFSATTVCNGQATDFTDMSSIIGDTVNAWQWNFGDTSGTSVNQSPTYTYSNYGTHSVTLIITTDKNCKDTVTKNVIVNPMPVADFRVSDNCFGKTTFFNDTSVIGSGSVISWNWNFGDNTAHSTNQNPAHFYNVENTYNVTLVVQSDKNCIDTVTNPVQVFPKPIAGFMNTTVCLNQSTQFTDTSKVNPLTSITSWNWTFGDVNSDTLQNPSHSYGTATSYTVTLIVESGGNGSNCKDTVSHLITVNPIPQPQCVASPVETDTRTPKIDFSTGTETSYLWNFAGIDTSSLQNPSYSFPDSGTFTSHLTVTNQFGCSDSCEVTIHIGPYYDLQVPNAFTPNPDGPNGGDYSINPYNNDVFFPITKYLIGYKLMIFDRWGELIFVSEDPKIGWDGYYRGKLCQQDVYVWKIKLKYADGKSVTKAGDVTLIR